MATVMPQSELMRKAVNWVSEQRTTTGAGLGRILDEAGMRFNLSPKEQEFLRDFFRNASEEPTA